MNEFFHDHSAAAPRASLSFSILPPSATMTTTQSAYDAILHANDKLQRANDLLRQQVVALKNLDALRLNLLKKADSERDAAIESRIKMERELLALRERVETAESSSARLEHQQLQKDTDDQLKVEREPEVQQEDVEDRSTEATGTNETHEKTVAAQSKTSTPPLKETRAGQDGRARVLAGAKNVAASVGAGPAAGARARVRPSTTARAHVDATASTASTRARVEATATFRAIIAATSKMSSAKKQTRVKTAGRRVALGNGC